MSERKRLPFLILILTVVSLSIAAVTIDILYNAAFELAQARLVNIAQSRARLIEAVACFNLEHRKQLHKDDPNYNPFSATLSQIIDAHNNFKDSAGLVNSG